MSFMNELENELNISITENGAVGFKTTKSKLVDFNFKVPSFRDKKNYRQMLLEFKEVYNENPELAVKYLFYLRDIRGGLGERDSFRALLKDIATTVFDNRVFKWIMEYGRADDLFVLLDIPEFEQATFDFVYNQLEEDANNTVENKPISLLAKWMPSINSSNAQTKELAKRFIKTFGITQREYRKTLAKFRKYLKIVERDICNNEWGNIDYSQVPSNANLKYNSLFLKHDEKRRREFLESLQKGETKINSSAVYPHDIVKKYSDYGCVMEENIALEEMWKALPDYVEGDSSVLVVRDGSGSMRSNVPNSNVSALDVATALAIYFSERQSGEFKDKFITFSQNPRFVDLSKLDTLHDKLIRCYQEAECANTDIEKTLDLVLQVAIKNRLKQEEIPTLLIISDMEFDEASGARGYYDWNRGGWTKPKSLFGAIKDKYEQNGYQLPKLVFWNVNSRTNTMPLTQNKNGVVLVSGFSTAIAKMVLSNKLDPYEALKDILLSERYKQVEMKK